MAICYIKVKKGSVEKHVISAFLCKHSTRKNLNVNRQIIPGFTLSPCTFMNGCKNCESLSNGISLNNFQRTIKCYDTAVVKEAVSFILSTENVSYLSWGTKTLKINGTRHKIPAIIRKKTRMSMYNLYQNKYNTIGNNSKRLGHTSFFKIAKALTAGDSQMRRAVDYVTGFLINDSFDVIKQIIGDHNIGNKRQALMEQMEAVKGYLKYGYAEKIREDNPVTAEFNGCILHQINYVLLPSHTCLPPDKHLCHNCSSVFQFFIDMKQILDKAEMTACTSSVLDDCCHKAKLFMAHKIRVINQQIAIEQIVDGMRNRCLENKASHEGSVVMDFKMKFDPLYYR